MKACYICPNSGRPLSPLTTKELNELNASIKSGKLFYRPGAPVTTQVQSALADEGRKVFYPLRDGIPLIMPNAVMMKGEYADQFGGRTGEGGSGGSTSPDAAIDFDEIEKEAKVYDEVAKEMHMGGVLGQFGERLRPGVSISQEEIGSFPKPWELWLDAPIALSAQEKAYEWLAPIKEKRMLQMGGHGSHAIKFLLAGASEAHLLSPSYEELKLGKALSEKFGVGERFFPVMGIAEQFPFCDNLFDAIYGGACLHHTNIRRSADEIFRILKPGGKAAFAEPRMTFWYRWGRRIFRSRGLGPVESQAGDRPFFEEEITEFVSRFAGHTVNRSRYFVHIPLTLLNRFLGVKIPLRIIRRIEMADGVVASWLPFSGRIAPIVAICVQK